MALQNDSTTHVTSRPEEPQAIVRACDTCRKKKKRCEPMFQGCVQCTKSGSICHFTPIALKRKPRRPAGFKYMARLEERLLEVEGILGANSSGKPTVANSSGRDEPRPAVASLQTMALTTPPDDTDSQRSLDPSQIPSPEISNDLGFDLEMALRAHDYDALDLSAWHAPDRRPGNLSQHLSTELRLSSLQIRQQLPPKQVALGLVYEMFTNYNRFLPLFDEGDFMAEFQLKYSTSSPTDACWWACLNVVLSIAHRLRALSSSDPVREDKSACGYIQNAMDVVAELNVRSLSAVQALVGMACVLQGTPNPEPASMLVGAALRLAQAMNLHRESPNSSLTAEEAEKRRRVFWKVYILDKDISLRTSRPFSQDDDDMDVRLPSNTSFEPSNVDLFNCRIGLALVQGQVYKQLYSVRAERQTVAQRAIAAQELSALLSYWKSSSQFEVSEHSKIVTGHQISGEMINKVVLRLTYIHCLTMIDRHLPSMPQFPPGQEVIRSEPLIHPGTLCLAESRQAIRLIEAIPLSDCSCVWMLLHAFFVAANSLLYNSIANPTSPNASSDLHLVEPFLHRLQTLAEDPTTCSRSKDVGRMHRACSSLNSEANNAVRLYSLNSTTSFS